jgi:DNA-binding NtrC family response regulator
MVKTGQGEVSVQQLKGMLYDPNRKPISIEEMHEIMMRAIAKANMPASRKTTKR